MYCINIYILKRKTVPNSNGKIVEIYKIDTLYTNIYNSSLSLLGTSTRESKTSRDSIYSDVVVEILFIIGKI
jgi:hypothetical protein